MECMGDYGMTVVGSSCAYLSLGGSRGPNYCVLGIKNPYSPSGSAENVTKPTKVL